MQKPLKKQPKKAITPTMVQRAEKSKDYVYKLSNGQYLSFTNKKFPINETPNQLTLF